MNDIPLFAVVGHPNEGKSSVVSTLTEDDRIPISAVPGETRRCVTYSIRLDGETLLRFVDTPGFQMPLQSLRWMQQYAGPSEKMVEEFIQAHGEDPRFGDDCELLRPIASNAGIIYVVDGSRPLRPNDEAEMEILRLTGRPRMALINTKSADASYTGEWKAAIAKTFNVSLKFDAHRATFRERIALLEALQHIEQEWGAPLKRVVAALEEDWSGRLQACTEAILRLLEKSLTLSLSATGKGNDPAEQERMRDELIAAFQLRLSRLEDDFRRDIKGYFLHNVFKADLASETIAAQDLFSEETWQVLGLTRRQLSLALATVGAATGLVVDGATAGITFGVFTLGGGTAGAIAGWSATRPLSRLKVSLGPFSRDLGGCRVQVGPLRNPQLLFVLLDRALIYFQCVSNWAHARRQNTSLPLHEGKLGVTSTWSRERRKRFEQYQAYLQKGYSVRASEVQAELRGILLQVLLQELN